MDALALGLALGLAAGVSPGPLLALVVTESLRSGWRAGVLTAAAPLVSDALIVATVILVLQDLPARVLPVIGVVGGLYVVWSGVTTWREAGGAAVRPEGTGVTLGVALRRAVVVNLLSPHPWIAWATALGPMTVRSWRESHVDGAALVAGFYVTLVGAKAVLAVLVARGRDRLSSTGYRRALQAAAMLLLAAGVALVVEFAPGAFSAG
jgi:threonine/homoserine/homoserine lactone efflux protein